MYVPEFFHFPIQMSIMMLLGIPCMILPFLLGILIGVKLGIICGIIYIPFGAFAAFTGLNGVYLLGEWIDQRLY